MCGSVGTASGGGGARGVSAAGREGCVWLARAGGGRRWMREKYSTCVQNAEAQYIPKITTSMRWMGANSFSRDDFFVQASGSWFLISA